MQGVSHPLQCPFDELFQIEASNPFFQLTLRFFFFLKCSKFTSMNVNLTVTNRVLASAKRGLQTAFSNEGHVTFSQLSISYFRKNIDWYTSFPCCVPQKTLIKSKSNVGRVNVNSRQPSIKLNCFVQIIPHLSPIFVLWFLF